MSREITETEVQRGIVHGPWNLTSAEHAERHARRPALGAVVLNLFGEPGETWCAWCNTCQQGVLLNE